MGTRARMKANTAAGLVAMAFAFLVRPVPPAGAASAGIFSDKAITSILRKVNSYQLANLREGPARDWIRGTYYTGVMAAYEATGDTAYLRQALDWGEKHQWRVGTDGPGANKLTCVQTWVQLYFLKNREEMIQPAIRHLLSGGPKTPTGERVWYLASGRRYVDSLYVAPPALAMLAMATGDGRYLRYMDEMFWDVHAELFDEEEGLFYRDKRFRVRPGAPEAPPLDASEIRRKRATWVYTRSLNGGKVLWSRGNGWAFAGIARILSFVPKDHPTRPRYVKLFRAMAASLAERQGEDGLWRVNLDDPLEYPNPETSGSGFFCYGFAWGVNNGLLDGDKYLPVVRKAWEGLVDSVSEEGKVCWGQLVAGGPYEVFREDSHEYVTGTFLLAGSQVLQLVRAGRMERADAGSTRPR